MRNPAQALSHEMLRARGRLIPLDRPLLMGVLNVTPDSFSDGGRYLDPEAAVTQACAMVEQGAGLIDIGAESSRPGSDPVGQDEEIRRFIPVVKEVCRRVSVPVSIDTTKACVARLALEAGAAIVNDISALRFDPQMGAVVAEAGAGLVLMHMQGTPKTMQQAPSYGDVVQEVRQFFAERMTAAGDAGIGPEQILLDPGIGFGKNLSHNLLLLGQLDAFVPLGRPILVGVSRKAFIGQVLDRPVGDRLMGTAAAVAVAILHGARVLRVHDVGPMRDVVTMVEAITSSQLKAECRRLNVDC
ncbi:MAG: dihydropteroate synthase [Nitrospirae bacterium]|nr:dihydropteroate synthase [Nitrospirota bacterium]